MTLDRMECHNKCFGRALSPWWSVLALLKYQNALEMGCFETKNGSKICFAKNDPRPFGVAKQVKLALLHCSLQASLAPPRSQKALKMGCFWDKSGSKMSFSKNDPRPFGVVKQVK